VAIWEEINWEETFEEALGHFKTLIRFNTVNPPGNEKPAAEYLAEVFRKKKDWSQRF
jgi:acetylornithine deacetylase/succinyl-diaminopimelate desuccinylase-like protein